VEEHEGRGVRGSGFTIEKLSAAYVRVMIGRHKSVLSVEFIQGLRCDG
jgi:hypothetical protein